MATEDENVSRKEFSGLRKRVKKLEDWLKSLSGPSGASGSTGATGPTGAPVTPTSPTVPTPTTGPSGPSLPVANADGVILTAPLIEVTGNGYKVGAVVAATRELSFRYLQIAIRGAGATDTAFSPGATVHPSSPTTLSGSGTGSGPMSAYVAYSLDGTTWVDGPKVEFQLPQAPAGGALITPGGSPVTTPRPGGLKVGRVGRSGLPWNQLVFRTTPQAAEDWGRARGLNVDGFLFFVARGNWQQMKSLWGSGHRSWLESGRIIVVTMPVAPESEGDAMNQRGANNAYKAQQRDLAKWYADQGFNRSNAVFRVGWEMNGNWYKWSCNRPGGVEAYKASIRNYVDNMRGGGLTQAAFNQCWNKGPGQSSRGLEAFAGAQWIDVVGIDQYDMWGPSFNASQWENELNKEPSAKKVAELAQREGIQWSWDEGGNTHGHAAAGGDNPNYWVFKKQTLLKYGANLAWDDCYDERGAPATLRHDFASNPKSDAKFRELWKPA